MTKKIFKINNSCQSPEDINFGILGLHKELIIAPSGFLTDIKYWKNYDGITYSDLYVHEKREFTVDNNTGLAITRKMTISWYLKNDTIGYTREYPLKYYDKVQSIQEGILNDDEYLGVTSMLMEEGLDCGDILGYSYLKNEKNMLVSEAFTKLSDLASKLTIITLDNYDKLKPIKQNDSSASFCKKIKKEDGEVDFNCAKKLFSKYKAYSFWPGIFLKSELKLKDIEFIEKETESSKEKIKSKSKSIALRNFVFETNYDSYQLREIIYSKVQEYKFEE